MGEKKGSEGGVGISQTFKLFNMKKVHVVYVRSNEAHDIFHVSGKGVHDYYYYLRGTMTIEDVQNEFE